MYFACFSWFRAAPGRVQIDEKLGVKNFDRIRLHLAATNFMPSVTVFIMLPSFKDLLVLNTLLNVEEVWARFQESRNLGKLNVGERREFQPRYVGVYEGV